MASRPAEKSRRELTWNERRRAMIASNAAALVGSLDWADETPHDYPAGRWWDNGPTKGYKCFLFIHDVLARSGVEMGFPHVTFGGSYPYNAGDWGNASMALRGWRVIGQGESPVAGDILAQQANYSDATGHVVIVGATNNWIGTGTWPGKPIGVIVSKPLNTPLVHSGNYPRVVRRYTGS